MEMATCKTSCGLRATKLRCMANSGSVDYREILSTNQPSSRKSRQLKSRSVPKWESVCFRDLIRCLGFLLGAVRFDPGNRALEPVLDVLAQVLFRLIRRNDGDAVTVQRNMM